MKQYALLTALGVSLLATGASVAGDGAGPLAEEIRKENLCRQAVSAAHRRGDTDSNTYYCGFAYTLPVPFWNCVVNRVVNENVGMTQARQSCQADLL